MFKNFDGQSKVKPNVSLRGASRKEERDALIRKNLEERQQRELLRRKTNSAIKIQAFVRGCKQRENEKTKCRHEFDRILRGSSHKNPMPLMILNFNFFFNAKIDNDRFLHLCKGLMKHAPGVVLGLWSDNVTQFILHIRGLAINCCRLLERLLYSVDPIGVHLRFLQTIMSPLFYQSADMPNAAEHVFNYVIKNDFFKYTRILLETKIPSSLSISSRPPTPLADAVMRLIAEPLLVQLSSTSLVSRLTALDHFVKDLLHGEVSPQMSNFMILALARFLSFPVVIKSFSEWLSDGDREQFVNQGRKGLWVAYLVLNMSICQQVYDESLKLQRLMENILLRAFDAFVAKLIGTSLEDYLSVLGKLMAFTEPLIVPSIKMKDGIDSEDSDSEEDEEQPSVIQDPAFARIAHFRESCLDMVTSTDHVRLFLSNFHSQDSSPNESTIKNICSICLPLLTDDKSLLHRMRLSHSLAFDASFLRHLWSATKAIKSTTRQSDVPLLASICKGSLHSKDEAEIVPIFTTFAVLFRHALFSLHDSDFFEATLIQGNVSASSVPFTLDELVDMSKILVDAVIGLLELSCFESKMQQQHSFPLFSNKKHVHTEKKELAFLCKGVTLLVRQIYARDCRRRFCPDKHWLSNRAILNLSQFDVQSFFEEDEATSGMKQSSSVSKQKIAIIKHIPFSVPFLQRVKIFQRILDHDKVTNQDQQQHVFTEAAVSINVNRNYLYQDAFDQLSRHQVANIKKIIRVKMINVQGLDEAGIDGGGLFREFLSQLLQQGFDPSYGFFKATTEQLLFPNPQVAKIFPNYTEHFHFLGRMLGKAIYENMLIELPFAGFFLCKLLNKSNSDVDIHHLEMLDPLLYKNLLSLRKYEGDIEDLVLNFTVNSDEFGATEVVELKPNGKDIVVTNQNKLEYIHLMADYKLNKQIRSQCNAFRSGLADVVSFDWLQMFDHNELQVMISGAPNPVDLFDLRTHTSYSGGYEDGHPYIESFWDIMADTTDEQRRKFLKFVTSCSRPPLLGFKELWPKFCIHFGGVEDRLPSASTCMNLLKLPQFENKELLKTRLLYAIESEAGFELS